MRNEAKPGERATRAPVAVYRPVRATGLPRKAQRHIGEPVREVVIQVGDHVLDPPLGFAIFEDGTSVLTSPDDLEGWDGSFTVSRPTRQSHR